MLLKATPSRLANWYRAILYRFLAAVEVLRLGALSDALVCRQWWNSPTITSKRDFMLYSKPETTKQFVKA